jgi:hypothetical protein
VCGSGSYIGLRREDLIMRVEGLWFRAEWLRV